MKNKISYYPEDEFKLDISEMSDEQLEKYIKPIVIDFGEDFGEVEYYNSRLEEFKIELNKRKIGNMDN